MAERPFGPYQLVKQIAVGGMAEIHLAKTRGIAGFEKFCALKMIHPNFAQDEQFIEMLIDEAKIAVQLQHVNIAQTFDLGRVGDTYYITMEFVDGADLYKILRRGSERDVEFPVDVAAFVAKEMSTGLDYAHRKRDGAGQNLGIVHRDVSPQNVLVSNAGEVKLVDFGIAKATMKARQTAVGVIKGKYYYMSPEQAWGERLDHRSDIFSAGIVLYEMLTGQMLYLEEDINRLLDMVRRANIAPVRTLRKDVPPQLERIVMHALAKKPEDRYQSAGDLASDLERFLHTYSPCLLDDHGRANVGAGLPDMRGLCMNVAGLDGGLAFNVVPAFGALTWSVRPWPGFDRAAWDRTISEMVANVERATGAKIAVELITDHAPFGAADGNADPVLASLVGGHATALVGLDFWTEAALYQAAGMQAIVIGPGDIGQAHAADEFVTLADLDWAVDFFADVYAKSRDGFRHGDT